MIDQHSENRRSLPDYLTPDYIADPWGTFFHNVVSGTATREELLDHAGMVRRCVDFFNPDVQYNDHPYPTVLIEAMHIATSYLWSTLRMVGLEGSRALFLRGEHTVTEEGIKYITVMKNGLSRFRSTDLSERQRLKNDLGAAVNSAHLMLQQLPTS